jgi:hypothetical protein
MRRPLVNMAHMIVTVKKLNRRSGPIANLADKSNIIDIVKKGFSFDSVGQSFNAAGAWFQDSAQHFYWGGGLMADTSATVSMPATVSVVTTAPAVSTATSAAVILTPASLKPPAAIPHDMPLSAKNCLRAATWMKDNFEDKIVAAVENTPFDKELVYAITCQETAQRWLLWVDNFDAETILHRSVFDASGDFPDTSRNAFPKNKAEMIAAFGDELTQMLIDEANEMRAMPQPGFPGGFRSAGYLYKGYGIFQYDLQHVKTDKSFFADKLWYSIDECVARLMNELKLKWSLHVNDMFNTVRAYNGSGTNAEAYAAKVSQFYTWIKAT